MDNKNLGRVTQEKSPKDNLITLFSRKKGILKLKDPQRLWKDYNTEWHCQRRKMETDLKLLPSAFKMELLAEDEQVP